ncbi:MAG: hypothetical protein QMC70_06625 [Bacteroidia bacterium]|tara:strand:- start:110 stop:304 length:195 start_codon:yes stop_codon:yes gene_type:complete
MSYKKEIKHKLLAFNDSTVSDTSMQNGDKLLLSNHISLISVLTKAIEELHQSYEAQLKIIEQQN